eukprot:1142096-Pelagomonas_calceolata.AAC.3
MGIWRIFGHAPGCLESPSPALHCHAQHPPPPPPPGALCPGLRPYVRKKSLPSTPESSPLIPNLVYFPDLKDALKSYMHA